MAPLPLPLIRPWRAVLCAGSPYRPKVVSARRVHVVGGWESILDGNNQMRLRLNEMKTVEFDTRSAGPGQFRRVYHQCRCLVNRGTIGVNSLPKTVTRQRRGCDLNPGPSAPESSSLTARLPTHPEWPCICAELARLLLRTRSGRRQRSPSTPPASHAAGHIRDKYSYANARKA